MTSSKPASKQPRKLTTKKESPPTARDIYAAQALGALIYLNGRWANQEEIKRQAFDWADYMLSSD